MKTVLKLTLVAAVMALPFGGAFGFLLAGAAALCIGSAIVLVAPIVRD